jgi:hypothetical protein
MSSKGSGKSPYRAKKIQRHARVLELRTQGYQFTEIADIIAHEFKESNYCRQLAARDFKLAVDQIKENNTENVHSLRRLELIRYDKYLTHLETQISLGDSEAVRTALKVSELRAKLLGLFAPVEIKIENIVKARLEEEFSYFFEAIFENPEIPDYIKDMLKEACDNMSDDIAELAQYN